LVYYRLSVMITGDQCCL